MQDPVVTQSEESHYLVTKEPQMISVAQDSYLLSVSGSYPQFMQADAGFNQKIATMVTGGIADFKKAVNDDYQARLKIGGDEFQKQFEQGGMYTLSWKAEIVQSNDRFISVIIRQEGYTGGAHGYHLITSYNYDVKNNKELMITDFMSLADASAQSRIQLKEKFQENGGFDAVVESMIDDGTESDSSENFKVFTFIPKSLTVYFPEYQVAPYVFGEQQVVLDSMNS